MKRAVKFIIIVVCTAFIAGYVFDFGTVCDRVLRWSVGEIDEGFDLSEEEFIALVNESVFLWETAAGRDLFEYDEEASFTINLVYDSRQKESEQASETLSQLEELKSEKTEAVEKYASIQIYFYEIKAEYEKLESVYEGSVAEYNSAVSNANTRGSISKEERQELEKSRAELASLRNDLEERQESLNNIITELNTLASENNFIAEQYNRYADYFNSTFADQHFEQGEYSGNKIDVYQFRNVSDLKFVLTHELGHALLLDHVDNPEAIMHYISVGRTEGQPVQLAADDVASLFDRCGTGLGEVTPWYKKVRFSSDIEYFFKKSK